MPEAASAGPSSRPADADLTLCTYRELFEHLENAPFLRSHSQIQRLVEIRLPELEKSIQPLPPRSSASKAKLAGSSVTLQGELVLQIDADQRTTCERISQRFDLDELEAFVFYRRFLHSRETESAAQPTSSKQSTKSAKATESLEDTLEAFSLFLFQDRLCQIRCVSALLRIAEEADNELYNIAQKTLPRLGTLDFGRRCLERFAALTYRQLPLEVRDDPRYSQFWANHGLQEQLALLEVIFMLFYSHASPSADITLDVLKLIQDTNFGQRQANEAFFDAHSAQLLGCICTMLTFVAVETLELEAAMDGFDFATLSPADESDQTLARLHTSPQQLNEALDILDLTSVDPARAPLLLAWALVLRQIEDGLTDIAESGQGQGQGQGQVPSIWQPLRDVITPDDGGSPVWTRLANAAFSGPMQLLVSMKAMIQSPLLNATATDSQSGVVVATPLKFRSVFKGLLLSVTELVRPEYVTDLDHLVDAWEATFHADSTADTASSEATGLAALSQQYWEVDCLHESRRGVLDMAKRRWPIQFRPLVRLMKALTGSCVGMQLPESDLPASRAVLEQLANTSTVAHILPSTAGVVRPPWEVIESTDHSVLDYRATRPIPVFGSRLVIKPGTCGRMVSELGQLPVVVVWELEEPISGWRLLRDVLANFVRLLPDARAENREDVFTDGPQPADFGLLAPDAGDHALVATEIIDLFAAVFTGAPHQNGAFFAHLEASSSDDADDSLDSASRPVQPGLVTIVLRILEQSLSAAEIPTKLVRSCYRLISLLLPLRPNDVWLALRSSNLVTGSSGRVAQNSVAASALLTAEMGSGSYEGLTALLELHENLLSELQRSQFSTPTELLNIKADVLTRAVAWMCESVWPEHQSWRYRSFGQRLLIGVSCVHILERLAKDRAARAPGAESMRAISVLIDELFVVNVSFLHLAPLISTLGNGQQMLEHVIRIGNSVDVGQAHELIEHSLSLARRFIHRRQEMTSQGIYPAKVGLFEQLFFEGSAIACRTIPMGSSRTFSVELIDAVLAYTRQTASAALCKEAALLVTAVCLSSAETGSGSTAQSSSLVGHLGSTEEVAATVDGIIDALKRDHLDVDLRRALWTMATAMVQYQPALATMLLLGPHSSLTGEVNPAPAIDARNATGLPVASDVIAKWQAVWDSAPALLDTVLHFLGAAWSRLENLPALQSLRKDDTFWTSVLAIVGADAGTAPEPPSDLSLLDGRIQTDSHEKVQTYSYRMTSKARALFLLSKDFQMPQKKSEPSGGTKAALAFVEGSNSFAAALRAAVEVHCNPALCADAEARLVASFPELPLAALRNPAKRNEYELLREFGDDYVYDTAVLRSKLEGLCKKDADELGQPVVDLSLIHQASLLLSTVNLDWSLIDSQTSYLRAWTRFLDSFSRRMRADYKGQQNEREVRDACQKAWPDCAKVTADEQRDAQVMIGVHLERLGFLQTLLEAAWTSDLRGNAAKVEAKTTDVEAMAAIVKQARRLMLHAIFSVEASVRGTESTPFHRQLFSIILLCVRKARQLIPLAPMRQSQQTQSDTHRTIHMAVDSFTGLAITSLRQIVDKAITACSKASADSDATGLLEEELTLVGSLVETLVRQDVSLAPHLWLSQFREAGLLPACVTLLRRAPARPSASTTSPEPPVFMPAILSLFLVLTAQHRSTEQLVLAGLMTALTSNVLSPALEAGEVVALLPTGFPNPTHTCWVTMLRLVISTVENLDGDIAASWAAASVRFIETEVMGFLRLYGAQLGRSLEFAPLGSGRRAGMDPRSLRFAEASTTVTEPQLNELHAVMRLFLVMASAEGLGTGHGTDEVLTAFAERSTSILQQLTYLIQRPHQLASLLNGGADMNVDGPTGTTAGSKDSDEQRVAEQMNSIAVTIVAALWHTTDGAEVLSREARGWAIPGSRPSGKALLRPTMRTAPGEPASIGTLLDLAAYCTETLQRPVLHAERAAEMVTALEETLALATAQLALSIRHSTAKAGESKSGASVAVESGIQRDLLTAIQAAHSAVGALTLPLGDIVGGGSGKEKEKDKEGENEEKGLLLRHLAEVCEKSM